MMLGVSPRLSVEAWNAEVARRIAEIERGEAELVDADEVFREFGLRFSP